MKESESESEVLKIEEPFLKFEEPESESESELLYTDSTAVVITLMDNILGNGNRVRICWKT
jgi:hypothetical protein